MLTYRVVGLTLLSFSLLSGCASTYTAGVEGQQTPDGSIVVTEYNSGLGVRISQVKGHHTGDLYKARVVIENTTDYTLGLQYQFNWFDEGGDEVAIDSYAWTPITLYGQNKKSISSLSPDQFAKSFRISVRDLKSTKTFKTNIFGIR